jgi:ribonuclease HI
MTTPFGTGSVRSSRGKVKARDITTGINIQAPASDAVLKAALEALQYLRTGRVEGARDVEARGEIVTGLRYLNPQAPDRAALVKELQALRMTLVELQQQLAGNQPLQEAAQAAAEAQAEAEKPQPAPKRLLNRLGELVEFLSSAGKALEAAHQTAPLVAEAVGTAAMLYQIAQKLL